MFVDDTNDNRRVVAVYCKPVNCNHLTPLLRFVVQLVSTVDNILTDTARRAVRLRWQSFLFSDEVTGVRSLRAPGLREILDRSSVSVWKRFFCSRLPFATLSLITISISLLAAHPYSGFHYLDHSRKPRMIDWLMVLTVVSRCASHSARPATPFPPTSVDVAITWPDDVIERQVVVGESVLSTHGRSDTRVLTAIDCRSMLRISRGTLMLS